MTIIPFQPTSLCSISRQKHVGLLYVFPVHAVFTFDLVAEFFVPNMYHIGCLTRPVTAHTPDCHRRKK